MNNYPAGIGNYFTEEANRERAWIEAEERVVYECGSGDLYEYEGEICNEEEILELINLEEDTEDNYRIDRIEIISEIARDIYEI